MYERLKNIPLLKILVVGLRSLRTKPGIFTRGKLFFSFLADYSAYRKLKENTSFTLSTSDLYPRILDKTSGTPIDPVYFYQDTWCAKKIFESKPATHTDVGSEAEFIGIVSQFIPVTMVDIRPLPVSLPSLSFQKGDITHLPFGENSIPSLSSICVIEHIGLGRYGDPLDPFGSEKAIGELRRVLAVGGNLYISVPIDKENKVYFNAHRAFTREKILQFFAPLTLIEERYIYGNEIVEHYSPEKGFGTGLYHFQKK